MSRIPKLPVLPIIGNALSLAGGIIEFLGDNFSRLGDTFIFTLPVNREVVVSADAAVFKAVLQKQAKNFRKDYDKNVLKLALGNGLLTNDGESWFRQRRLAQPVFYKSRLESFFTSMQDCTLRYVDILSNPENNTVLIDQVLMQLTADIVMETLLGQEGKNKLSDMQRNIYFLQSYMVKVARVPFFSFFSKFSGEQKKFKRTLHDFDEKLYELIRERRMESDRTDLLSMLMAATDEDTGEKMDDKQLRDELLTIYVAGYETSGYTLAWALYNLCKHPKVYRQLKDEVNAIMQDGKLTVDKYKELVYLRQVVDETLRLFPTAYILSRESKEELLVNDVQIPEKTMILLSTYHLHRNAKYWEHPTDFLPERFDSAHKESIPQDAYYPFGGGSRMCIGINFAIMEITIVLAILMYNFDFELVNEHPVALEPLVTLKPKHGIKLNVRRAR